MGIDARRMRALLDADEQRGALSADLGMSESPLMPQEQEPMMFADNPALTGNLGALTTAGPKSKTLAELNAERTAALAQAESQGASEVRAAARPQGAMEKFMDSAAAPLAVPLFMLGGPAGIAAAMALGLTSNKYRSARRERAMEVQDRVKQRVSALPKPLEMQPQFIPGQPGQQDFVRDTSGNLVPVGTTAPALTPEQRAMQELERKTKLAALEAQLATAAKNSAEAAKIQQEIDRLKRMEGQQLPPGYETDPATGQPVRTPGQVTQAGLLTDYRSAIKPFADLQATASNFESGYAINNSAGDLALINSFQRIIDPGAVVREADVQLIQQTAGMKSTLEQLSKVWKEGKSRLPPEVRQQLRALMNDIYTSATERAAGVNTEFKADSEFYNAPIRLRDFKFTPRAGEVATSGSAVAPRTPEDVAAADNELAAYRGSKGAR